MDAKVVWQRDLKFDGSADSGFTLPLDGTTDVGGEGQGFRPMELLAVGLAGCTAMDVISILKKKQQQVTGFEVRVHGERAQDHPRVFTRMELEYIVKGKNIDPTAVSRAVELSETKYCSAQAMLRETAEITNKITILNE